MYYKIHYNKKKILKKKKKIRAQAFNSTQTLKPCMVQADELGEQQTGACSPGRGRGSECVLAFFCIFLGFLHQEELSQLLLCLWPWALFLVSFAKDSEPQQQP